MSCVFVSKALTAGFSSYVFGLLLVLVLSLVFCIETGGGNDRAGGWLGFEMSEVKARVCELGGEGRAASEDF